MNGVNKIIERINASAKADADKIKADAAAQIKAINDGYALQIAEIRENGAQRIARERAEAATRATSAADAAGRTIALEAKGKALNNVYKTVEKQLMALCGKEREDFLFGVLRAALADCHAREREAKETFGENIAPASYALCLNAADTAAYGKALLARAGEPLTLGEPVAIPGGLVLKCGETLVNCSLEMIMKDAREKTEARVCEMLFAK